MARELNQAGLDLIMTWEGLRLAAYRCTSGVPTIGWGHTAGVKMGHHCTRDQAVDWLTVDVAHACELVEKRITVPLTDNQFAALVSLAFNCPSAFGPESKSTLRRRLNAGDYECVPEQMRRWNKSTNRRGEKVVDEGLVNRRGAEVKLWLAA